MLLLLAQPKPILVRLAGGDSRAMAVLAVGILLGVAAAGLAPLALGARNAERATWAQSSVLLLTLMAMVLLRDQVRKLALVNAGVEQPAWIAPQWGPFAVFAVLLVAAVATIAWMARALARGVGQRAE
jgi:hypothetical protein